MRDHPQETKSELTLDFGFGTTVLQKADIESIPPLHPQAAPGPAAALPGPGRAVRALKPPPGAESWGSCWRRPAAARERRRTRTASASKLMGERAELALQLIELSKQQAALAPALDSGASDRDYSDQGAGVQRLSARMSANTRAAPRRPAKLEEGEGQVARYLGDYNSARRYAAANLKRLPRRAADEEERVFFETADAELATWPATSSATPRPRGAAASTCWWRPCSTARPARHCWSTPAPARP